MKRLATVVLAMLALIAAAGAKAQAQTITAGSYAFSRSGFAPTDISTGNTQLIGANADNVASAVTDIGFTFWFAGTPYTQFSVNENGLMKLGSTQISGSDAANSMASTVTLPKIAPYWDDLATGTNGSVVYKLTGTAPNRILIVNWNVTVPKNTAGAANALIQVQLSEATGLITFTYGSPALAANAGQYSIGIGASATDFASVTPTSATAATVAYGTANNANTISPGVYTRYNFSPDATAPTVTFTALANIASTANRTLTATIGDAMSGVPTTGGNIPRIYYKKNFAGTYVSSPGTLAAGNGTSGTWTFTIDHAAIGGVIERDSVYYFVIAQDQAATGAGPNVKSNPAGAVATNVSTITVWPAAPSVYKILGAPISGTKTVGTSGADYTSLTNAGGLFTDINDGKLTGNVVVNIITDLTTETGAVALNAWTSAGGPFTVTINPVGARTVSGSAASAGLVVLNGATGLTIDGLNDGTNSLVISNTNPSSSSTLTIKNGASNNRITNTTLKGVVTSSGGVVYFGDGSATSGNNNNSIDHCLITAGTQAPFTGFYLYPFGTQTCMNNVIDHNVISNFSQRGIHVYARMQNLTISNNQIYQTAAGTAYSAGIYLDGASGTTNIFNNKIYGINTTYASLGTARAGIQWFSGTGTVNMYNNVISLDAGYTGANGVYGMQLGAAATYNVYYNSIYIGGTNANNFTSAGIYKTNGTLTLKNNAIFNARSLPAVSAYYKNYGVQLSSLTGTTSNNNVIYANGTGGVFGAVGSTDYAAIANWKTGTAQDSLSFSGDPGFTSTTDLTPDPANPNSNILNNRGVPVAGITTDAAGNARSVSGPTDIGAAEFTPVPVFYTITGNAGIAGATLSWTDGTAQTMTADGNGAYSITVPYGWSGLVTPSLIGYTFTPSKIAYDVVVANASAQNYSAAPSTNTISGNAGMAGVTLSWMDGSLKTTVSDSLGGYSIAVPNNWSGSVTPSRAGYAFTPANIAYTNVLANIGAQNYSPSAIIYTISGNAGTPLAVLQWTDTTAKSITADVGGNYSLKVSYNWSGSLTPSLTGHSFIPSAKTFANVLADQPAQNFTSAVDTVTISGNAGAAGVQLIWTDGALKTADADSLGNYSVRVSYNWSGTITPSLTGYSFVPANRVYANVTAAMTGQNYSAAVGAPVTISGNAGHAGVTLNYTDITPKTVTSDSLGNYSIVVPSHWSGLVTPVQAGYTFAPAAIPFSNLSANQIAQNFTAAAITYTISGNTGGAGVTLQWTDTTAKSIVSDANGNYMLTVSYNWSGTVTPALAGFTFAPAATAYANIQASRINQNYTAAAVHYVISGNAGRSGVLLSWTDGSAKTATADSAGNYSITVSYNWSGTVTPSLSGYTFAPASMAFTNVLANQSAQNFSAAAITYTISGNAGKAGTILSFTDTTAKTVVADTNGNYAVTVSYNWSGMLTPSQTGYAFTPANKPYANVLANQTAQNFSASAITYLISGNAGKPGATLSWTDTTAKSVVADVNGNFAITVSYNWSGTVTPSLAGSTFTPAAIAYTNVLADKASQNFTASGIVYTLSGNAGKAGAVVSWTDVTAKNAVADSLGNYSITVSYNWSGTVTPSSTGYSFTPANIAFANVLTNHSAQNFSAAAVTYVISGNAGKAGATVSWTDTTAKSVNADASGNYSITVSYGWTGSVTPSMTGYAFTPANNAYAIIMANQTAQNFTASGITYTISGAAKAGAIISWTDGTPKTATVDSTGQYSITVPYNWSGVVTATLAGYSFTPVNRTYANLIVNQTVQSFTSSALTFTISGNAGKAGATLSWTDSTAKTALADSTGHYSITVSYNWTGTVTPSLVGNTFTPAAKAYTNVLADQATQDFTVTAITYTISGNAGVPGATLSWTDGTAKTATADSTGRYSITVSYHWTGTVTPSSTGNTFVPVQRSYTAVASNDTAQNYVTMVNVNVKVFLQGPFSADTMTTTLNKNNLIPLTSDSAYAASVYGYAAKVVTGIPNTSIVDWILVELRTGTAATTKKTVQAGFLKNDGTVVDIDGVSPLAVQANAGGYYIVIRHRNHLPVMSAAPVALSNASAQYDFSSAQSSAYGTTPMVALGATKFGMAAGSNDGSILISTNDYNAVGRNVFMMGYFAGDHNMNGSVFIDDYNFVGTNLFMMSQVP